MGKIVFAILILCFIFSIAVIIERFVVIKANVAPVLPFVDQIKAVTMTIEETALIFIVAAVFTKESAIKLHAPTIRYDRPV